MSRPAQAGFVVLSENFNAENGNQGYGQLNYNAFAQFDVTAGKVDLIPTGGIATASNPVLPPYDFYPGHGLYVDMNGTEPHAGSGTLTSKATFAAGSYTLDFDLGNNHANGNPNSLTVSLGSFSQTLTRSGNSPLDPIHLAFTTTGGNLVFGTPISDTDEQGVIVDNIVLSTTETAPLPPTLLAGCVAGVFGLGWRRIGRKAA